MVPAVRRGAATVLVVTTKDVVELAAVVETVIGAVLAVVVVVVAVVAPAVFDGSDEDV